MSRRSARLKSKGVSDAKNVFDDFIPPESDSEYEPEQEQETFKPAASRRSRSGPKQTKGRRIRGKRGILQRMLDMPLDVLFEVCHIVILPAGSPK